MSELVKITSGQVLTDSDWITVTEICRVCRIDEGAVHELAELGLVSPRGSAPGVWEFPATVLPRLRVVGRLMRDLGLNASGAALAVELLEVQRELERQIRRLERLAAGQG
jgi:chaperone modulatory protein CbpM